MTVKGDAGIAKMRQSLKDTRELMGELSEAMADEALELVASGFEKQENPYGDLWQKKKVDDGRNVLVGKTVRLRRGWHKVKVNATKWAIEPSVPYASAHQDPRPRPAWGGKSLPRRAMLPFGSRGLPESWKQAMADTVEAAMRLSFSLGSFGGGGGMSMLAAKMAGMKRSFSIRALVRKAVSKAQK
jgi:phage gpG-like protein